MNAHPIIDPDDGPAYANLTHDHDLKSADRDAERRLRGHGADVSVAFRADTAEGG